MRVFTLAESEANEIPRLIDIAEQLGWSQTVEDLEQAQRAFSQAEQRQEEINTLISQMNGLIEEINGRFMIDSGTEPVLIEEKMDQLITLKNHGIKLSQAATYEDEANELIQKCDSYISQLEEIYEEVSLNLDLREEFEEIANISLS